MVIIIGHLNFRGGFYTQSIFQVIATLVLRNRDYQTSNTL
jgi:hypothetical protein